MKIFSRLPLVLLPLVLAPFPAVGQTWQEWVNQNSQPPAQSVAAPNSQSQVLPAPQYNSASGNSASRTGVSSNRYITDNPILASEFMRGCAKQPAYRAYCQCFLEEAENTYTFEEFMTIVLYTEKNKEIPAEIYSLAQNCLNKL